MTLCPSGFFPPKALGGPVGLLLLAWNTLHKLQGPSPFLVQLSHSSTLRVPHIATTGFLHSRMNGLPALTRSSSCPPTGPYAGFPPFRVSTQNPMVFPSKEFSQQGLTLAFHPSQSAPKKNQVVTVLSQGTSPQTGDFPSTRSKVSLFHLLRSSLQQGLIVLPIQGLLHPTSNGITRNHPMVLPSLGIRYHPSHRSSTSQEQ